MASSDVTLQSFGWGLIVPLVTVYLFCRIFQSRLRNVFRRAYAYFLCRFGITYNRKMDKHKKVLFNDLHELAAQLSRPLRIVEIGAGAGANFKYYPQNSHAVCVDPNPYFEQYLVDSATEHGILKQMKFLLGQAEEMKGVDTGSVDAVICTLVLCTVQDVDATLKEVLRILKPGGKFFFLEHVAAENMAFTSLIQNLLNPVWKVMADNCHLTRRTWAHIDKAGFQKVEQERFLVELTSVRQWLKWPFVVRPHLSGIATK